MDPTFRILITALLLMCMAFLSALHSHLTGISHFDYDIGFGMMISAIVALALGFVLATPRTKLATLIYIFLVPLLCAVSFSWGEFVSEISLSRSVVWSTLWFAVSYISSFAGFLACILIKWLVVKYRPSKPE